MDDVLPPFVSPFLTLISLCHHRQGMLYVKLPSYQDQGAYIFLREIREVMIQYWDIHVLYICRNAVHPIKFIDVGSKTA